MRKQGYSWNLDMTRIITTSAICIVILIAGIMVMIALNSATGLLNKNTVTVKGYAEKNVPADIGNVNLRFSAQAKTLPEIRRILERDRGRIMEYLRLENVKDAEIQSTPLSSNPVYATEENQYETGIITGYNGFISMTIESEDLDKVARIARNASGLLEAGIAIQASPPCYFIRDMEQFKVGLLQEASRTARIRADEIAKSSNAGLGALKGSSQGVFQVTAPVSVDFSGYGEYDTGSRIKKISIVVTNEYQIQ